MDYWFFLWIALSVLGVVVFSFAMSFFMLFGIFAGVVSAVSGEEK